MEFKLLTKKYKQKGDITWEYNALRNLKDSSGTIKDFKIKNSESLFNINLENPIDIECQPSYDGTVNLILNDDINPPRIINTRWTRTENNTYKIINREQINQSNLYREDYLDRETRLFRNTDGVTKIDLYNVSYSGKLKAGNYIIYAKYMDEDYNETDIIAQSGVISIFNGTFTNPSTVSGGFMDEETDKSITLKFYDVDTSFAYIKLYVYRTSCDSNGIKLDYAYKINNNYEITDIEKTIHINGFEEYVDISIEELNIQYNTVDSVKTQAQVQNMLFFANVSKPKDYDVELQDLSLYIKAEQSSGNSIGVISPLDYKKKSGDDILQTEYYSPLNIYYNLGYWPDEYYRFGVVYIYNDDHLSPVYNLRGCWFNGDKNKCNINNDYVWENRETNKIPTSSNWINDGNFENTKGVFRFNKSYDEIYKIDDNKSNLGNKITDIKPLGIQFSLHADMKDILISKKIKGLFFVRQTRIPTILCQGYSVGIDRAGYYPMIHNGKEYEVESFKTTDGVLVTEFANRLLKTESSQSTGLLCVDAYINKQIQSMFDTSEFKLEKVFKNNISRKDRHYHANISEVSNGEQSFSNLIYIDPEIPQKTYNNYSFSTKAGMQEDLKYCGYFETKETTKDDAALVRGIFTSFVGTTVSLEDNCIYNIRTKNYDESFCKEYFEIRMNDKSPFYAISPRYNINPKQHHTDFVFMNVASSYIPLPTVFRGDCFTNTVTTRMHRNFTSSSVPINDTIIDNQTWKDNFKGMRYTTDWNKINKADVDAVPIGSWITYKCLSNFNLSLRCIDDFQIEEQSIMGNPRGFYPKSGMSTNSSNKIPESNLMNDGYNSLMGVKRNFTFDIVPYLKDEFDTRIMFSNIQVDGAFKNSYKVFQGLSYEDIDRQYGSITKIIPWGVNLFCVFEHGLAIIPVNEKALLQTTEGANIHMYGSGVLQKQVVLISDSVGSIWKDSIVKTPLGIYGVDTENHKIWRYSDSKKLEIISDFNMQRYLHDNIELKELEKYTILGTRNVKSHYNAFKGDIMFTYYNKDKIWNICYNENMGKWITRYSWTPYMSENIDHSMFSFDLLRTRIFGLLNTNNNRTQEHQDVSVVYSNNKFGLIDNNDTIGLSLSMNNLFTYYNLDKLVLKGYYWDRNTSRVKYDILTSWDKTGLGDSTSSIKTQWIDATLQNVYHDGEYDENSKIEAEMLEKYKSYENEPKHIITFKPNIDNAKYLYFIIDIEYTPYVTAADMGDIDKTEDDSDEINILALSKTRSYSIGLVKSQELYNNTEYFDDYFNALISSIFVHGRSINADEINYFDDDKLNQCLPTKWYDSQEPFEFEVVVNEPKGLHKIFDNLVIISNNVEPESLEIEITGDVYGFNKEQIFKSGEKLHNIDIIPAKDVKNNSIINENGDKVAINDRLAKQVNTRVHWDPIENSYSLAVHQDMINIKDYGRRLGNIYYNEDKWYVTLKPIYFKEGDSLRSTKIRDKYAKVRVKYSGEELAVIVALQSLFTLSYV